MPIWSVNRAVVIALDYVRQRAHDIRAVHVDVDPDETAKVKADWEKWGAGIPLVILPSPYRSFIQPLLDYIEKVRQENPGGWVTVVLGAVLPGLWWALSFAPATGAAPAAEYAKKGRRPAAKTSPVIAAAKQYAEAIASGDRVAFGRLDFDCQFALVSAAAAPFKDFPPGPDPVYGRCWTILVQAHDAAVEQRDEGVNAIWPGNGFLVFYRNQLTSYPPSFYVMDRLGLSPPGGGLRVEPMDSAPIPAASFRMRPGAPLVS